MRRNARTTTALSHAGWIASGERLRLTLPRGARDIFVRESGSTDGASVVFLHGFPTSSWDWAKIEPPLAEKHSLLFFDFLGFGHSDKPQRHRYSYAEQTDIAVAAIAARAKQNVHLVAHDYAVTIAQELLARNAAGALPFRIASVSFLNGGLYSSLHRALPIQKLLRKPVVGRLLSLAMNKAALRRSMQKIFSTAHPLDEAELDGLWASISHAHGHRIAYRLIHYIGEREANGAAWAAAMEQTRVPLQLVWGMLDPVSGAHVFDHATRRMPAVRATRLDDAAHYPQIEVPERVAEAIDAFIALAGVQH